MLQYWPSIGQILTSCHHRCCSHVVFLVLQHARQQAAAIFVPTAELFLGRIRLTLELCKHKMLFPACTYFYWQIRREAIEAVLQSSDSCGLQTVAGLRLLQASGC